jgi:hypothetical protein
MLSRSTHAAASREGDRGPCPALEALVLFRWSSSILFAVGDSPRAVDDTRVCARKIQERGVLRLRQQIFGAVRVPRHCRLQEANECQGFKRGAILLVCSLFDLQLSFKLGAVRSSQARQVISLSEVERRLPGKGGKEEKNV